MQFNDTTNETGVVQEVYEITETDSSSYTLKSMARRANRWIYRVGTWMFKSSPDWKWIDSNNTNPSIATQTLVDNKDEYTIPTLALAISGVSILNSSGDAEQLTYITEEEIKHRGLNIDDYQTTKGVPEEYTLIGNKVRLFPAADSSQVTTGDGFRLHLEMQSIDELTSSDTTQTMGLPENLEMIIPLGVAHDWFITHDPEKALSLRGEIETMKRDIEEFMRLRNTEVDTKITPSHNTSQYI